MVKLANAIQDLRRGVDHIGVGVAAVVHDGNGRILLMKRGPKARDEQGRWDICGGAIEFGETIADALKRELQEELCVDPITIEFLTAYDAHRRQGDVNTHWVQVVHTVQVDPQQVRIGEPHKIAELGWYYSHELPEPLHSQFQKSFRHAHAKGVVR